MLLRLGSGQYTCASEEMVRMPWEPPTLPGVVASPGDPSPKPLERDPVPGPPLWILQLKCTGGLLPTVSDDGGGVCITTQVESQP
jgi:hypothetical protein